VVSKGSQDSAIEVVEGAQAAALSGDLRAGGSVWRGGTVDGNKRMVNEG
jgi:hypothetical protein